MRLFVPAPFVSSGFSYASAIAAITNKSIYVRGDSYGGSNGQNVSGGNAWANAGSAGGSFSGTSTFHQWETNSLNGMPGVRGNQNGWPLSSSINYSLLFGTGGAMTFFAVEKRNGSQGTSSLWNNGAVILDSSGTSRTGIFFNTRQFYYQESPGLSQASGLSFADNAPYVLAVRVKTSGHLRVNLNGSIYSDTTTRSAPSSTSQVNLLRPGNTNNNYGYEYIVTADVLADALIDNIVIALKKKWGIT